MSNQQPEEEIPFELFEQVENQNQTQETQSQQQSQQFQSQEQLQYEQQLQQQQYQQQQSQGSQQLQSQSQQYQSQEPLQYEQQLQQQQLRQQQSQQSQQLQSQSQQYQSQEQLQYEQQQLQQQQSQQLQSQERSQYEQQEFEEYEEDDDEEDDEEYELKPVLEARVRDVSLLENNLAPICLKKDQITKVLISSNGLYFNVEGDSKNIQATTFIDASLFETYEYNLIQEQNEESQNNNNLSGIEKNNNEYNETENTRVEENEQEQTNKEDVERVTMLRLNLSVLLDCIRIFKSKNKSKDFIETVGQIVYPNQTGAFEIDLEDNGIVTWCNIAVNSIDDNYEQPQDEMKFDSTTVTNTIVIDSMGLKTALSELDWGCRTIDMYMFKQPPMLSMQSTSQNGVCRIDCPSDSEAVERLDSIQDQSSSYLSSLLRSCVNALQYSTKVSIRMNIEGMLSVQLMIKNRGNVQSFAEFLINPETNEDEDEDEDEEDEDEEEDEYGYENYEQNENEEKGGEDEEGEEGEEELNQYQMDEEM
ncbi:cell cycle checkpoint protein rad1 [Anaeramoeba flamelloides]|uniref:Cell cycle checkpoint protein rad1 n=1 Tax=Anaeramoeba flamelloides TaxID=1746091 RepID=A0AAV7YWM7_9EUKA|nr:cell cycle checkpoint protein rad1 [Anaeramoeba flamelloides]